MLWCCCLNVRKGIPACKNYRLSSLPKVFFEVLYFSDHRLIQIKRLYVFMCACVSLIKHFDVDSVHAYPICSKIFSQNSAGATCYLRQKVLRSVVFVGWFVRPFVGVFVR